MDKPIKIWIDTDIGDDVDDAFALLAAAGAAKAGRIAIAGVSTVFRDVRLRARLAKKNLALAGLGDVPVFAGRSRMRGALQPDSFCFSCEDLFDPAYAPDGGEREMIAAFTKAAASGQLTLLSLGPTTNAATLLSAAAKRGYTVKTVAMGGAFYSHIADWNFFCDTKSAQKMLVLSNDLTLLGADVGRQARLPVKTEEELFSSSSPAIAFLRRQTAFWRTHWQPEWETLPIAERLTVCLADPFTFLAAITPEHFETEKLKLAVMQSGAARGVTLNLAAYGKTRENPWYAGRAFREVNAVKRAENDDARKTLLGFLKNV